MREGTESGSTGGPEGLQEVFWKPLWGYGQIILPPKKGVFMECAEQVKLVRPRVG